MTSCVLLWQVGRQEPVMVLRVDKEKGYIDLSKRRVAAEDIQVGFQLCSLLFHPLDIVYVVFQSVLITLSPHSVSNCPGEGHDIPAACHCMPGPVFQYSVAQYYT